MKISKRVKNIIREWVEAIVVAFFLAMVAKTFFIQAFKIPSGSMRMTLIEGDRLLVNKLRYGPLLPFSHKRLPGLRKPDRGDIIVFIYPMEAERNLVEGVFNPPKDFIKRIIGKPGEEVEIRNGDILIDGQRDENPVIRNIYYYNKGEYGGIRQVIKVPEGHYFVLGDNSASSSDSRFWGFVPEENIIGRAEILYWPLNRIRFIK
jgi:signal peptidase I